MENLDKIFESLDDKIFTTQLKESLQTQFNEAVDVKAESLVANRLDELSEKSEDHIATLNETAEEHIEMLNEKSEQHIEMLNEKSEQHIEMLNEQAEDHIDMLNDKAEEFVDIKREEMCESVSKYMDRAVDAFVEKAESNLTESVKHEKADMMLEAFETMLVAGGIDVANIVEARDEKTLSHVQEQSEVKYDALVDENIELINENADLIKLGVMCEMKEGLSLVESEKFEKLAKLVTFEKSQDYCDKLETIKESIRSTKNRSQDLNELNELNGLHENAPKPEITSSELIFSHLL